MYYTQDCPKCRYLISHRDQWYWAWSKLDLGSGAWYKNSLDDKVLKSKCTGCIRVYAHKGQVALLTLLNKFSCCSSLMEKDYEDINRMAVDRLSPLFVFSLNTLGDKLIAKRKLERFIEIRDSREGEI